MRPGRVTLPVLEADPAENVLTKIEAACGVRPDGCPFRATLDPFVGRVVRAHRAWKNGHEIEEAALRAGVETYDAAINAIEVADMRAEKPEPPEAPRTVIGKRPGKR